MKTAIPVFLAVCLAGAGRPIGEGRIAGRVYDAETGRPIACSVAIRTSDGQIITDNPSFREGFRADGVFEKSAPSGPTLVTVSRGFDYVAEERRLDLQDGERKELNFRLRRRTPLRREGWYTGDNHDHMIHGEQTVSVDFAYAALAGRAEGLDYLALAQMWNIPRETPENLAKECARQSTADFLLTWNLEAPKNYFRGDASKCLGHGWTAGMRGRTKDGRDAVEELLALSAHDFESEKTPAPNFQSHALIHSLGGVVSYSHPCRSWQGKWGGQGGYPVEDDKFISNLAAELPFDTIAGPTYDTIDVLMPRDTAPDSCAQQLWFLLLNKGYRIAASGSTDATFDRPGGGTPGQVRMFTHLRNRLNLSAVAAAIKAGHSFITSGPLLTLEVNGRESGDVVRLARCGDAPCPMPLHVKIRAWASGGIGSGLKKVELVRNGEVLRSFDLAAGKVDSEINFDLTESDGAWYLARCYGASAGQAAITNPIFFEREGSRPPQPGRAKLTGDVRDAITGRPLSGEWEIVRMVGKQAIAETSAGFQGGKFQLDCQATAEIRVNVPGYERLQKSIFLDYPPLLAATLRLRSADLIDWKTFDRIHILLNNVRLEFALTKTSR